MTISPAKLVFSIILMMGIVFVFLLPPIQAPDEDSHFTRAVMVSEWKIKPKTQNGQPGQYVPASLVDYIESHSYLKFHGEQKYAYIRWIGDSQKITPEKPDVFHSYSAQNASPLLYAPQALGILGGRALFALVHFKDAKFNWAEALYFARLGNLLAFAGAVALAIRWAGRYQGIMAGVAMMPMSMQAAASVSYDTPIIICALLFLAFMARLAVQESAPTRKQYLMLLAMAFFLGQAKTVYAPVLLLTVIFKSRQPWREFILAEAGLLAAALVGLVGMAWISGPGNSANAPQIAQQIDFLKHHPFAAAHVVRASLVQSRDFYLVSMLGELGWLDTNFAVPFLVLLWGVLICAVAGDALAGPSPFGWLGSGSILVALGLSVFAVFLALYITWTSLTVGIGAPSVDGVQGRYFLPLLPFAMAMIAATPRFVAARATNLREILLQTQLTAGAAILVVTAVVLLLRYWIPAPP